MKRALTRRVPLLVTMLTAALIVVGWGVASAGPCIPDGQTCRTDQKCCSGVCVKETKKSFGTCCSPTTCAAEGANCGMIADGCGGTLDCGTCIPPQTCGGGGTPNVCAAVCGNGVTEPGEACDGQAFCTNCRLYLFACCDLAVGDGVCSRDFYPEPGPPFCQEAGAVTHLGTRPAEGPACPEAGFLYRQGPCSDVATFPPTTFCCEIPGDPQGCFQITLSDTESFVTWMLVSCEAPMAGYHPISVGTCGPDLRCHPG